MPSWRDYVGNRKYSWLKVIGYGSTSDATTTDLPSVVPVTVLDQRSGERLELPSRLSPQETRAIRWGLGASATVVGVVDRTTVPGFFAPLFLLVGQKGGEPFFAGACTKRDLEDPMRAELGATYGEVMADLLRGPVQISASPSSSDPTSQILAPGDAPEALLKSLTHIAFDVDMPESWAGSHPAAVGGPFVLISRVNAGWNDAVELTYAGHSEKPRIGAYLPSEGVVDFWVLGRDGDLDSKIRLVGSLDSAEVLKVARQARPPSDGIVAVRVESTSSIDEVVAGEGQIALSLG